MTIRIRELNIKASLSGNQATSTQEDKWEQLPTNSLLQVFYSNKSSKQNEER